MSNPVNGMSPLCKVTSLYFNYYQSQRAGINSHPECGLNVMPQDISRFPTTPYNAVAFAMNATDKGAYTSEAANTYKLKLHAEFKGPPGKSLWIRTVDPLDHEEAQVKDLESYLENAGVCLDEDGNPTNYSLRLLGDIKPTTVKFDTDGNSYDDWQGQDPSKADGVVELVIDSADIWSRGIYASWQLWQWQYSESENGPWEVIGGLFYESVSVHRIFVTLAPPTWPWSGYDEEVKDVGGISSFSRTPYIGALEWACKWATGETTEEGIASKITSGLNDGIGTQGMRFKYDGAPNYTDPFGLNIFDCGRLIDRLNGKFGRGPNVNCVDCAHMVISLANALGCQLQPGRIQNPPDGTLPFLLNPVTLIGYNELTSKDKTFSFHQVAISPAKSTLAQDCVYDACLKFDIGTLEGVKTMLDHPNPLAPLTPEQLHGHPVDIPIGISVFTYGYMAILAKSLPITRQKNLTMYKGDKQNFSISALKFQ